MIFHVMIFHYACTTLRCQCSTVEGGPGQVPWRAMSWTWQARASLALHTSHAAKKFLYAYGLPTNPPNTALIRRAAQDRVGVV